MERDIEEQVVSLLKRHLNLSFTLFQFAEISGRDLLDLLCTIIHQINEQMPEKIGSEKIEATVARMSEFLRVLKYEFPIDPEEWDVRFGSADKAVIHPAILFLLRDFEEMKKRGYISRYLEEVPIPEEIKVDPTVAELFAMHTELREQFETTIQEYDELGGTNVDELRASIADMEADKGRLSSRVSSFKRRMENVKNLNELLKWTTKLRQEGERELKLQEQLQRLSDEKRLLIHRQQTASDRVDHIRSHMESRLQKLRSELESLKNTSTTTTTATTTDSSSKNASDTSLILAQKQVAAANQRYAQKMKQLEALEQQRSEFEKKLEILERQRSECVEVPSANQFVDYVRSLKTKNETFKGYQGDLNVVRKELAVMMRTDQIVKQAQESAHRETLAIERTRGVSGFREARQQLENVSAQKMMIDDTKGKTLEEMSEIAKKIQKAIQARQNELKPLVAKLQEQRKLKAAVESRYLTEKQKYNNTVSEFDAATMELVEEAQKHRNDILMYQSKLHNVGHMFAALQRSMKRASEEEKALETGNPISRDLKTYSDLFQKASRDMKKETKNLKGQKKTLGSQSGAEKTQLDNFQSLQQLLMLKGKCQKEARKMKEKALKREEEEKKTVEESIDLRMAEEAIDI